MTDTRREQERAELYKSIWAIANDLRGSVDGWDFKNYVLTTLFYRYISENLTEYINRGEREAGDETFDYAQMSDEEAEGAREGLIAEKAFSSFPQNCSVMWSRRLRTILTLMRRWSESSGILKSQLWGRSPRRISKACSLISM